MSAMLSREVDMARSLVWPDRVEHRAKRRRCPSRCAGCAEKARSSSDGELSQISDHEACGLVDERSNRFVRQDVGAVQNGRMGQRLYGRNAYERREIQVDSAELVAVAREIVFDQGMVFAVEGRHLL